MATVLCCSEPNACVTAVGLLKESCRLPAAISRYPELARYEIADPVAAPSTEMLAAEEPGITLTKRTKDRLFTLGFVPGPLGMSTHATQIAPIRRRPIDR